jgi:hypothetical protein
VGLARVPDGGLATTILPRPLLRALEQVFAGSLDGVMLVGGTALAGFYAGHRRSDDLDLFTRDPVAQDAAVRAVKSLTEIGASFGEERSSSRFHHVTCRLDGHDFTIQVVHDPGLFVVGSGSFAGGVFVASLETLLKMKCATLVSRASEKDLYDLAWLFEHAQELDVPALIALGSQIDGGVNAESVLISLVGAEPDERSCDFSRTESRAEVLAVVRRIRRALMDGLEAFLRAQPALPITGLIRRLE